jgi:hypothetical protein
MPDHVRTAAEVWAAALATHRRRVAAYIRLEAQAPPTDEPSPVTIEEEAPPPSWRGVISELSRQTGIPASWLRKGDESRGQPITALRQLAMALLVKLGHMSLPAVARMFGGMNHTTALHARERMRPILDACELTEADPSQVWIEAALPLVLVHVAQLRAKNRTNAAVMNKVKGNSLWGGA